MAEGDEAPSDALSCSAWVEELKPTDFLQVSEERITTLATLARGLFGLAKQHEQRKIGPFDELLVDNFDEEQIWQQLELRNKPLLRYVEAQLKKQKATAVSAADRNGVGDGGQNDGDETTGGRDEVDEHSGEECSEDITDGSDDVDEEGALGRVKANVASSENDITEDEEEEDDDVRGDDIKADEYWASSSDDDDEEAAGGDGGQKLSKLDRFLVRMDEFAEEGERGDGEEDMDELYGYGSDEDEEDEDDERTAHSGRAARRMEAFDDGGDSDENDDEGDDSEEEEEDIEEDEDDDDDDDDDDDPTFVPSTAFNGAMPGYLFKLGALGLGYYLERSADDKAKHAGDKVRKGRGGVHPSGGKDEEGQSESSDDEGNGRGHRHKTDGRSDLEATAHARARKRLSAKLSALEAAQVAEKPWQLTGEVSSSRRPVNSLLEADLDFEAATKLTPVITEEVTSSIEDIIKARIKEGIWDDVTRKAAIEPGRYRPKPAELSTEKSKVGLGEQYANEYAQQILGASSAESAANEKAHQEVRDLFTKLSSRLDALFNFHATPKPHKAEATVRAAVSTVSLEEAMPTAMGEHEALAPEEVYAKRAGTKALASREELTQDERKALRRKKKRVRARRSAEAEERELLKAKLQPGGSAAKRIEAKKLEKDLADAKRKGTVTTGRTTDSAESGARAGSAYTRSAQFFKNMQHQSSGGTSRKRPQELTTESPNKSARYML